MQYISSMCTTATATTSRDEHQLTWERTVAAVMASTPCRPSTTSLVDTVAESPTLLRPSIVVPSQGTVARSRPRANTLPLPERPNITVSVASACGEREDDEEEEKQKNKEKEKRKEEKRREVEVEVEMVKGEEGSSNISLLQSRIAILEVHLAKQKEITAALTQRLDLLEKLILRSPTGVA